jgi:hypothetical protein
MNEAIEIALCKFLNSLTLAMETVQPLIVDAVRQELRGVPEPEIKKVSRPPAIARAQPDDDLPF